MISAGWDDPGVGGVTRSERRKQRPPPVPRSPSWCRSRSPRSRGGDPSPAGVRKGSPAKMQAAPAKPITPLLVAMRVQPAGGDRSTGCGGGRPRGNQTTLPGTRRRADGHQTPGVPGTHRRWSGARWGTAPSFKRL